MNRITRSTMSCGLAMRFGDAQLKWVRKLAERHQEQLDRLASALSAGDHCRAEALTRSILRSFAGRLSAAIRSARSTPVGRYDSLEVLKVRAGLLNPYRRIDEVIRQVAVDNPGGPARLVLNFAPARRALQTLCADILDVWLPPCDFDFLRRGRGADAQMLRVKEMIEKEGYDHVVAVDIRSCFRSVNHDKLVQLLPLPHHVTRNVLLVQDGDTVEQPPEWKEELFGFPLDIYDHITFETDTAARQGLPQGSLTSTLIMSRAVLGPLVSATGIAHRSVIYGDDITVCAKGLGQARESFKALSSALENSLAGPLTIGRHHVGPISEGVNIVKYGFRRKPAHYGGGIRIHPSKRSYDHFSARARQKFLDGDPALGKGRVSKYRKAWPASFPLWQPTPESLGLLWQTAFEARTSGS
ncbi:reverse transcriptase domain-containing protein [Reyranella sp.]|uniref:reverse transcriptase domain-containing protein n=1 Tax=Reyranella sp. TaxID=1929291 RepID=UPI0040363E56